MSMPAVQRDILRAGEAMHPAQKIDACPCIELEVSSKERAVDFYSALFGQIPAEYKKGVARFDLIEPRLTLVLTESAAAVGRDGHLGIQMKYMRDVNEVRQRLEAAGYKIDLEDMESSCCFSIANKIWVSDPDRNLWEVYVVIASNATDVRCGSSCACEPGGCG